MAPWVWPCREFELQRREEEQGAAKGSAKKREEQEGEEQEGEARGHLASGATRGKQAGPVPPRSRKTEFANDRRVRTKEGGYFRTSSYLQVVLIPPE